MVIAYRWNPTGFHPIEGGKGEHAVPKLMDSWKTKKSETASGVGVRRRTAAPRIDYPRPDERIDLAGYAFRIDAPGGARVEVSIDGGDWRPCRAASGYWWFDWDGYRAGEHEIRARAAFGGAQPHECPTRRFTAGAWPQ